MKRTNIKDYLEIVGMFGVIVSLVFVGFEMRQNSKIAKLEAYGAYTTSVIEITLEMSGNPILAGLLMKSYGDLKVGDLSDEEYGMLFSYFLAHLQSRSALYKAIEEGILPASYGSSLERTVFFNTDVFRSMWTLQRREFDDGFVKYFEDQAWNTEESLQ